MDFFWLVYILLLPLVPFGIAEIAVSASIKMSRRRWIVHSLALLLIVLTFPIYVGVGLIMEPSMGSEGQAFVPGVEWVGALFYMFTGSMTFIGYAIFAFGYAIFELCARRRTRARAPAS